MTKRRKTLTAAEREANRKAMEAALPTMKANGAFLLAEQGFTNPTAVERRAAELVAMLLSAKHPLFNGMMFGCTLHEIAVVGELAAKCGNEGDQRPLRSVPGLIRSLIEQTAAALPIKSKRKRRAA